uniref:U9-hexatoxin-Hi1 n=1 Tax=Hadronyche infensa TaxID=153481 RepID=T91A_HADIN
MKLYLVILVTSVALAAASPTRTKEEPIEDELLEALLSVEKSLFNEETTVMEKRSCVIGWKQRGQKCERDCECCGVAATCIGERMPGFCGYRTTNNNLGQYILYGYSTVSNGVSAILCAA